MKSDGRNIVRRGQSPDIIASLMKKALYFPTFISIFLTWLPNSTGSDLAACDGSKVSGSSNSIYQDLILALDPLAYWDFENATLIDQTANGYDATASGTCFQAGKAFTELGGLAYFSAAAGDLVNAGGGAALAWDLGDLSVAAWAWADPAAAGTARPLLGTRSDPGKEGGWVLECGSDDLLYFQVSVTTNKNMKGADSGDNTVCAGGWVFIVATYDGSGGFNLFVNGTFLSSKSLDDSLDTGSANYQNLTVGGGYDSSRVYGYWDGYLDEVAVFDSVLSGCEVQSLWETATGTTPGAGDAAAAEAYAALLAEYGAVRHWGFGAVGPDRLLRETRGGATTALPDGVCANRSGPADGAAGGRGGYALQFQSFQEEVLSVPYTEAALSGSNASVAFWFNSEGDFDSSRELLSTLTSDWEGFSLHCNAGGSLRFYVGYGSGVEGVSSNENYCLYSGWRFIVLRRDASKDLLMMFVDGVLEKSVTPDNELIWNPTSPDGFKIGGGLSFSDASSGSYFWGAVDEVAVFDSQLSACRQETLYYHMLDEDNPDVVENNSTGAFDYAVDILEAVVFWDFNDVQNSIVIDSFKGMEGVVSPGACVNRSSVTSELGHAIMFHDYDDAQIEIDCSAEDCFRYDYMSVVGYVQSHGESSEDRVIFSNYYDGAGFYLECSGSSKNFRIHWGNGNGTTDNTKSTSTCDVGEWVFVGATLNTVDETVSIYVNGLKEAEVEAIGADLYSTIDVFRIGGGYTEAGFGSWYGKIDSVAVFEYTLEPEDMAALYEAATGATVAPSVSPTPAPTPAPTARPTVPSGTPTRTPTGTPTRTPSRAPTPAPTPPPTPAPTLAPTAAATLGVEVEGTTEDAVLANVTLAYNGSVWFDCANGTARVAYWSGGGEVAVWAHEETAIEITGLDADTLYECHFVGSEDHNFTDVVVLNVTTAPEPPTVEGSTLDDTGGSVTVELDSPSDKGASNGLPAGSFDCTALFSFSANVSAGATVCTWTSSSSLRMCLGSVALLPGDTVVLQAGVLAPLCTSPDPDWCKYWPTNIEVNTTVSAPSVEIVPEISAQFAANVSKCGNITVDISGSSGGGVQGFAVQWLLISPNSSEIQSNLESQTNSTELVVHNDLLVPGTLYSFHVTVWNFAGNNDSATIQVQVSNEDIPAISIDGPNSRKMYRFETLSIYGISDSVSVCDPDSAETADYSWECLTDPSIVSSSVNPRHLLLDPYTLDSDTWYAFRLTAARPSTGAANAAAVLVHPRYPPLRAAFAGGRRRAVGAGGALDLAVLVQDLDQESGFADSASTAYSWSCATSSGDECDFEDELAGDSPVVEASYLEEGLTYQLTVTASISDGRNVNASTKIVVRSAGSVPAAQLTAFPVGRHRPGTKLALLAAARVPEGEGGEAREIESRWTTESESEGGFFSDGTFRGACAVDLERSFKTTGFPHHLAVTAGALASPSTYVFALRARYAGASTWALAEVAVLTNDVPCTAGLAVAPAAGTALLDMFTLEAHNWLDADAPLTYTFGAVEFAGAAAAGRDLVLSRARRGATRRLYLPQGSAGRNHTLGVFVAVTDVYGASARAAAAATVRPPPARLLEGVEEGGFADLAARALAGKDPEGALALVNAATARLNVQGCSGASEEACAVLGRAPCGGGARWRPGRCGACLEGYVYPGAGREDNGTGACVAAAAHCGDGFLSGDETGVDCGGSCEGCNLGGPCAADADCAAGVCGEEGTCAPAAQACGVEDCNGRGQCLPHDYYGRTLETCVEDEACVPRCVCEDGYAGGGQSCDLTSEEWEWRVSVRHNLTAVTLAAVAMLDATDDEATNLVAGTVLGLLGPVEEVRRQDRGALVGLLAALAEGARARADLSGTSAVFLSAALDLVVAVAPMDSTLDEALTNTHSAMVATLVPGEESWSQSQSYLKLTTHSADLAGGSAETYTSSTFEGLCSTGDVVMERNEHKRVGVQAVITSDSGTIFGAQGFQIALAEMEVNPYVQAMNGTQLNSTQTSSLVRAKLDLDAANLSSANITLTIPNYTQRPLQKTNFTQLTILCMAGEGIKNFSCGGNEHSYNCEGYGRVVTVNCFHSGEAVSCGAWGAASGGACSTLAASDCSTTCSCSLAGLLGERRLQAGGSAALDLSVGAAALAPAVAVAGVAEVAPAVELAAAAAACRDLGWLVPVVLVFFAPLPFLVFGSCSLRDRSRKGSNLSPRTSFSSSHLSRRNSRGYSAPPQTTEEQWCDEQGQEDQKKRAPEADCLGEQNFHEQDFLKCSLLLKLCHGSYWYHICDANRNKKQRATRALSLTVCLLALMFGVSLWLHINFSFGPCRNFTTADSCSPPGQQACAWSGTVCIKQTPQLSLNMLLSIMAMGYLISIPIWVTLRWLATHYTLEYTSLEESMADIETARRRNTNDSSWKEQHEKIFKQILASEEEQLFESSLERKKCLVPMWLQMHKMTFWALKRSKTFSEQQLVYHVQGSNGKTLTSTDPELNDWRCQLHAQCCGHNYGNIQQFKWRKFSFPHAALGLAVLGLLSYVIWFGISHGCLALIWFLAWILCYALFHLIALLLSVLHYCFMGCVIVKGSSCQSTSGKQALKKGRDSPQKYSSRPGNAGSGSESRIDKTDAFSEACSKNFNSPESPAMCLALQAGVVTKTPGDDTTKAPGLSSPNSQRFQTGARDLEQGSPRFFDAPQVEDSSLAISQAFDSRKLSFSNKNGSQPQRCDTSDSFASSAAQSASSDALLLPKTDSRSMDLSGLASSNDSPPESSSTLNHSIALQSKLQCSSTSNDKEKSQRLQSPQEAAQQQQLKVAAGQEKDGRAQFSLPSKRPTHGPSSRGSSRTTSPARPKSSSGESSMLKHSQTHDVNHSNGAAETVQPPSIKLPLRRASSRGSSRAATPARSRAGDKSPDASNGLDVDPISFIKLPSRRANSRGSSRTATPARSRLISGKTSGMAQNDQNILSDAAGLVSEGTGSVLPVQSAGLKSSSRTSTPVKSRFNNTGNDQEGLISIKRPTHGAGIKRNSRTGSPVRSRLNTGASMKSSSNSQEQTGILTSEGYNSGIKTLLASTKKQPAHGNDPKGGRSRATSPVRLRLGTHTSVTKSLSQEEKPTGDNTMAASDIIDAPVKSEEGNGKSKLEPPTPPQPRRQSSKKQQPLALVWVDQRGQTGDESKAQQLSSPPLNSGNLKMGDTGGTDLKKKSKKSNSFRRISSKVKLVSQQKRHQHEDTINEDRGGLSHSIGNISFLPSSKKRTNSFRPVSQKKHNSFRENDLTRRTGQLPLPPTLKAPKRKNPSIRVGPKGNAPPPEDATGIGSSNISTTLHHEMITIEEGTDDEK